MKLMTLLLALNVTLLAALRLDSALVSLGHVRSRAQAKTVIKDGLVKVDGAVVTKVAFQLPESAAIEFDGEENERYVSRAGNKLRAALDTFQIDVSDADILDIGASTGGFTDCMLQAGAASAVCVDNGHSQLHPTLVADERICNLEGLNARELTATQLPRSTFRCIVVDVSFISLQLILPSIWPLLDPTDPRARLITLVKPQFEVGRLLGPDGIKALRTGKGVLSNEDMQIRMLSETLEFARNNLDGCAVLGTLDSPILGGDGNREFLAVYCHDDHAPAERGPFVSTSRTVVRSGALSSEDGPDSGAEGVTTAVHVTPKRSTSAAKAAAYAKRREELAEAPARRRIEGQ
jgi:23S rRNA (cytidine1920-2'-O)/16S rRNA (cytidine1409-2'-O)-methyltransferase